MSADPRFPAPPVLLTKAEALDHAARKLEEMAVHLRMVSSIVDVTRGDPAAAGSDVLKRVRAFLPDPALQIAAAADAAAAIRGLALEERLVAARVANGAGLHA
ncbi:hypothetical protein [Sphingomonas sp. GM_Shp_2]|uniref:hypothetical protein n=1 Tax=Sphingomonas sp. GM_Shp_2 TaxID=2937380 RepID=UPI00226A61DB|nr:hypothetical protein [Sphingomonas sp. GM_Shp_2]